MGGGGGGGAGVKYEQQPFCSLFEISIYAYDYGRISICICELLYGLIYFIANACGLT